MLIISLTVLLLAMSSYAQVITGSQLIIENEGSHSCMYQDSYGDKYVGIGFSLTYSIYPLNPQDECTKCGIPYNEVLSGKYCLTQTQIMCLFTPQLNAATTCAVNALSNYYSLCENAQAVAIDIAFALKCQLFSAFDNFISDLNSADYPDAESDVTEQSWCQYDGGRCQTDAAYLNDCNDCRENYFKFFQTNKFNKHTLIQPCIQKILKQLLIKKSNHVQ